MATKKLYDDKNLFMTNVDNDNSDTTYTNKHKNTEYNVRNMDEWAHLHAVRCLSCFSS